jgi:PAS domain S-box-containing protein
MYRNIAGLEGVSFQRILEASLNEIYIFDPETLRFLFVNRGALLNLGYTAEEATELTPLDLKPDFKPEGFAEMIGPLLRGERELLVFETRHLRKDRTLYDVDVHLQLIRQQGTSFFLAIILDTTERNRLAREREEAVLLAENAAAAKSRFLAHMSHEIRTPLNAVIGYAEALSIGLGRDDPGKIAEILGIISRAGRELDELITHILEFAREEGREGPLAPEPVRVSDLLAELDVVFLAVARQHRVSHATEIRSERTVLADRARLKSAILNLVSNAAKYGRPGGRVAIAVEATAAGTRCIVADDGIGISPGFRDRIFTPFSREGRNADVRGAGIGLAIARSNVERMGGALDFSSRPDEGSTFWIDLPAAEGC